MARQCIQQSIAFGGEIYRLRIKRGLTQAAAAKLCGLTRGYYSQLENSKRYPPPPSTLKRIAVGMRLAPSEATKLQSLADTERCGMVHLPAEMPATIANVVRQLTLRAHRLSPARVHELETLLAED